MQYKFARQEYETEVRAPADVRLRIRRLTGKAISSPGLACRYFRIGDAVPPVRKPVQDGGRNTAPMGVWPASGAHDTDSR